MCDTLKDDIYDTESKDHTSKYYECFKELARWIRLGQMKLDSESVWYSVIPSLMEEEERVR